MNWANLDSLQLIALAAALGFASGLRLYGLVLGIGLAGRFDLVDLPQGLLALEHSWVLSIAGALAVMEFLADKIPAVDSLWDGVHTFIRLPAGAVLAANLAPGDSDVMAVILTLLGGGLAATAHFAKASTRAALNTSPEPFSNWTASLTEDVMAVGLVSVIALHPVAAGVIALLLAALGLWLSVKLWRFLRRILQAGSLSQGKRLIKEGNHG